MSRPRRKPPKAAGPGSAPPPRRSRARDLVREALAARAAASAGSVPGMIVLLAFEGEHAAAATFAEALRVHLGEAAPYIETLDFTFPRPPGLKPAWTPPRQWIDYQPSAAELTDLRPDLRPPTSPRADWSPPDAR